VLLAALLLILGTAACGNGPSGDTGSTPAGATAPEDDHAGEDHADEQAEEGDVETLPEIAPAQLAAGEKLHVVATTTLVADVARRVGGDQIELTTLMPGGVDPHNYTASPQDLRTLNDAQLILINGYALEEPLMPVLETLEGGAPVVSVSAGIVPLLPEDGAEGSDHAHAADPHTWLSVPNVVVWTENVAAVLAAADPANADAYAAAAAAYGEELVALDTGLRAQIDTLAPERRKLVTDHAEFGYFAQEYGFEVVGAVVPAVSTLAAASAQDLAALQDVIRAEKVPAVFVGANVNTNLAAQLAEDLGIQVVTLQISALSEADGPIPDYPTLMRALVEAVVAGLSQ
jgi:ABC-type Zn uptake system ZnuABC Zn-binding protein ZnuA